MLFALGCGGSDGSTAADKRDDSDSGARRQSVAAASRPDGAADGGIGPSHNGNDASTDGDAGREATSSSSKDGGKPVIDAGSNDADPFPNDEDFDGDGLANGVELKLGTDPRYLDTDMDGVSDDLEVGSDRAAPVDSDKDGVIDALENRAFDNDRDATPDDTDHADRWQFVYGRFVPAVLANAGNDPVRFELKLAKAEHVKSVSVGMSSTYFRAEWAPDQLEIDGKPLAKDPLELFDDGTHGDVIAGDHVYSRSGITTHMAIRSDGGESNGKRCRVLFNQLSVSSAAEQIDLPLGITSGTMPAVISDYGLWLPIVRADLLEKPQSIENFGQSTAHVLNIVDAKLLLALEQLILVGSTTDLARLTKQREQALSITKRAFAPFDADFDFVYAFTSEPVYTSLAGFNLGLANEVQGTGLDMRASVPESGSKGRLQALLSFRMANEFPLTHETMHSYGVYLQPELGTADHHWGTAGTYGVLGGFDPSSLVDHGDGTFTVGHFSEAGNDWRTTPFSNIELYLMGLVPASSVTPIPVLDNVSLINNEASGVNVSAQKRTVTIEQIVAAHGARRAELDRFAKSIRRVVRDHFRSFARAGRAWTHRANLQ